MKCLPAKVGIKRIMPKVRQAKSRGAEYQRIRARGYSTDAKESNLGGSCFGMAIFSAPGKVDAAICLSMPTSRMLADEARQQRIVQALRDAADEISRKLMPPSSAGAKVD